jgi:hypothetical protein
VIIGVKTVAQLEEDMEPAGWDIPGDVWNALEKETRPDEDYLTWFNKRNYERIFATVEFHDETDGTPESDCVPDSFNPLSFHQVPFEEQSHQQRPVSRSPS